MSYLLLEQLGVVGALSSEQVEWAMCRIAEPLQLFLPIALLSCFYSPLLLGGALMRGRGRVAPASPSSVLSTISHTETSLLVLSWVDETGSLNDSCQELCAVFSLYECSSER